MKQQNTKQVWEAKYKDGNFYERQADGRYFSFFSLSYLKDENDNKENK